MVFWHKRSKRKRSSGILKPFRKKRRMDRGSDFIETVIGDRKIIVKKVRGNRRKLKLKREIFANINLLDGKTKRAKILEVLENKANKDFARRKIITKGALIETELGKAVVTSRTGQHGIVNAVFIESGENEKKKSKV